MKSINNRSLISKVSPVIKKYGLFILAFVVWLFLWTHLAHSRSYHFIWIPTVLTGSLILSLFLVKRPWLRIIPTVLWASVPAIFALFFSAWLISLALTSTTTYYLGMDIRTPDGIKTCSSMVQFTNRTFNFWPSQFIVQDSPIIGEATFCDLDNGKNLVAVLAFEKDLEGKRTLSILPWLAAGYHVKYRDKGLPFIPERQNLTGKLTPIIVTFSDIDDPMSIKRVYPSKLADIMGAGYSIKSIWVEMTRDMYKSSGIASQIPQAESTRVYSAPFKTLGLVVSFPFSKNY